MVLALAMTAMAALPACNRRGHRVLEVAYVSAPQASLRDQVAAIYNRVGNVKNGERLEVLEREKRFARVRTASGIEGWIEQRYLVDQKTYDGLQKLTQENQNAPVQAPGVLRNDTNLHITPGRETEHLYQLKAGATEVLESASQVVIAYEPVWAIGTGRNATGAICAEMVEVHCRERTGKAHFIAKARHAFRGSAAQTGARRGRTGGCTGRLVAGARRPGPSGLGAGAHG